MDANIKMIKQFLFLLFTGLFLILSTEAYGDEPPIAIDDVLRITATNSPKLSASRFREIVAKKSIDIAKANYWPSLTAEAIDDTGFQGSMKLLEIGGLMGSPYRSGYGAGLILQQIIWDFGRTSYNVEATRHAYEVSKQDTRIRLYQIELFALQTYYECTYFRTERDIWKELIYELAIITKEVQRFVNTGQVTIVDRYLSLAQLEEAQTAHAFYAERLKKTAQELATIMNVPKVYFTCPPLPKHLTQALNPNTPMNFSPFLAKAIASRQEAFARLKQEESMFHPKIVALASVGEMADARVVPKKAYTAGIGIVLPLVDLHISGHIQRAAADLYARREDVESQKQFLGEMNAKYDEIIQASIVRLEHLRIEYALAIKAFKVAKRRYFTLEGELIDLREAFRNLARVETAVYQTRTAILQARGSKALLNGSGSYLLADMRSYNRMIS